MNTTATQYSVVIKHKDGKLSYMSYRDRTEWALRTARKHARDCTIKLVSGQWDNVQYVAVVAA